MNLEELVSISRRYGSDRDYVVAGGGNTSLKEGGRMWVKASGRALADIDESGFVEMDLASLHHVVGQDFGEEPASREARFKDAIYAARLRPELGQRPSVECAVHALFPQRVVVHTHATFGNMVACSQSGEALCREIWGGEVRWVPYVDPGFSLAKLVRDALAGARADRPAALLLRNHGLFVAGRSSDEVSAWTDRIIQRVKTRVSEPDFGRLGAPGLTGERCAEVVRSLAPALRGALAARGAPSVVSTFDTAWARHFACLPDARRLTEQGPLVPDQIVYCKSFPMWLDPGSTPAEVGRALDAHVARTGFLPKVALVPELGLLAIGGDAKGAQDAASMYEDAIRVMLGAEQLGGVHPMSRRDREFIDAWEVEQYRRSVASSGTAGRLAGKVALVTGAAQGFGLGISQRLAELGAHVAMADLNGEAAQAAADSICADFGPSRAMAVRADVTQPNEVADMVLAAVWAFGGLDLVVSNAGILRAGSVKEQSPEEFRAVTEVNYTSFFLVVQAAAPILAKQREANSEAWTDIVQINSKSGLEGSNRNGAYAGSKFGSIGLVQSFAKELVEDGIKVNAICPGNYFDGPLWADPETGLFAQYLRTGKVPGAATVEDVRRFYESKVPMGRGCTVDDVVNALCYVVEQQYETGQAIPVTGGQVMLR